MSPKIKLRLDPARCFTGTILKNFVQKLTLKQYMLLHTTIGQSSLWNVSFKL